MEAKALRVSPIAGNENTALLKILALIFMVIDHVGAALVPQWIELRILGRIAFPLYAWCLVVGAEHTRCMAKYALRLALVGLISQPCYVWALNHGWLELNIFATLLLGLLAVWGIRENRFGSSVWAPALALLCSCLLKIDYGWKGVTLILLLYAARKSRPALLAVMIAFCLYWGQGSLTLTRPFGIPLVARIAWLPYADTLLSAVMKLQFCAALALPLMLLPMRHPVRLPKAVAYAAYPIHLLVIGLIRYWPPQW